MTTRTADRNLDPSRGLRLDAVGRVDVLAVTAVPDPRSDAGPTDSADHDARPAAPHDGTVISDDALLSLEDQLSRAQFDSVAATVSRRRSLTESLQVAFAAYWDTVVAQRDAHLAVRTRPTDRALTTFEDNGGPDAAGVVSSWLTLIADVHQIRWELPEEQVALLVSATLEGLTVNFLASGDPEPARAVLRVLAYQVGRYGRRPAKNQQH